MELALLTRCLSTTLNLGTNGWKLEIFKLADLTMPPSLLDLSSFPACLQVEVLTVLPHLQGNIEIGRHKDRNAEVGNTKHRIYRS